MRLPNGFGTVYKLSGNRRCPWIARVTAGWTTVIDKNGKPKQKQNYQTIGYFEEKKQAIDALSKYRFNPVLKENITLDGLYKEWSESKYQYITQSTKESYQLGWKYLSKYKNVKFRELRTSHLQSVVDSCYKSGMSSSSLNKIRLVASMMYDYAIQNDILNKNYAKFVHLPKVEKEEKTIFNELEIKKILDAAGFVEWADTILILIYTGMRVSEMLELTKFSVNLEQGIITGGIKTDAGKDRQIPINPKIMKFIKKWYDKNGDTLICGENGQALSSRVYREKYYKPTLRVIGVSQLNPHSCRHTFASMLSKASANTVSIQKLLGHTDYALTANVYTHSDVEELRKAINLI